MPCLPIDPALFGVAFSDPVDVVSASFIHSARAARFLLAVGFDLPPWVFQRRPALMLQISGIDAAALESASLPTYV
jgi:hypothetical protein